MICRVFLVLNIYLRRLLESQRYDWRMLTGRLHGFCLVNTRTASNPPKHRNPGKKKQKKNILLYKNYHGREYTLGMGFSGQGQEPSKIQPAMSFKKRDTLKFMWSKHFNFLNLLPRWLEKVKHILPGGLMVICNLPWYEVKKHLEPMQFTMWPDFFLKGNIVEENYVRSCFWFP